MIVKREEKIKAIIRRLKNNAITVRMLDEYYKNQVLDNSVKVYDELLEIIKNE